MRRLVAASLLICGFALAGEPVTSVWLRTPQNLAAAVGSPEVHSVEVRGDEVVVRSSGVSLAYLGPLQASPQPAESSRELEFHIPLAPRPARGKHAHVPPDFAGVFVNGVPIYNQFEAISYQGQNLWHYDPIALGRKGEAPAGLIEKLIPATGSHSPMIGFALDGFPVYGPWAYGGDGRLRRMRSSYRLRDISERSTWADGTRLTPGQYGPPVSNAFPLGTFAEDYEYVAGSGDLDRYNGRFAITPEYPQGAYGYFLATDAAGTPAFPYLLASEFYGEPSPVATESFTTCASLHGVTLRATALGVGVETLLRLQMPARFLEYVHEKPIHMMIVSADLAEFAHIHPELASNENWEVRHTFPHAGRYRVYLEFTPPGEGQRLEFFDLNVPGASPPGQRLTESARTQRSGPLEVTLHAPRLQAGRDLELRFSLSPNQMLQPYLGAWAHFTLVGAGNGEGPSSFIHAHPVGDVPEPTAHIHVASGPPPTELRTTVSFPHAGLYKLWAQFQIGGEVETVPFVLRVEAAPEIARPAAQPAAPPDAIHISISAAGYEPARVEVPKDRPVKLWFTRSGEPNCGSQVIFPALNLQREIPLGGSLLVELPPQPSGELRFNCGMNMLRGMIVVR